MTWNWEHQDWPHFAYDSAALTQLERQFLLQSGEFIGACKHIGANSQEALRIEIITDEAVKTSKIEGEFLNRESVQSSLRLQFGLGAERPGITPAERGISEMMVNLYRSFAAPLTDDTLFAWHRMLMSGDRFIHAVGGYRRLAEPMQVVSGPDYRREVHFEAPPFSRVPKEMKRFVGWFNDSAPQGGRPLPALTRAGIAHLYFVSIHPFEDGNGRIGRALAEKSLAQNLGQPSLIALADTIEHKRKDYYSALERNNRDCKIDDWLQYFAQTVLQAQRNTIKRLDFYVAKAKFYERLRGSLNARQEKAVARMFQEGVGGFTGGMSADKYIGITRTSRATATRDLQGLVKLGALRRTGELKHTRYHLKLPDDGEE